MFYVEQYLKCQFYFAIILQQRNLWVMPCKSVTDALAFHFPLITTYTHKTKNLALCSIPICPG